MVLSYSSERENTVDPAALLVMSGEDMLDVLWKVPLTKYWRKCTTTHEATIGYQDRAHPCFRALSNNRRRFIISSSALNIVKPKDLKHNLNPEFDLAGVLALKSNYGMTVVIEPLKAQHKI